MVTTCLRLALPQQAVVDEDAGQLVADRLVDQDGGDAESTPPDSPQITVSLPTCARIFGDRLGVVGAHRPVAGEAGDLRTKFS